MASRALETARRAKAAARRRLKARLAPEDGIGAGSNASAAAIADADLWPIRDLYQGKFALEAIGYVTVLDYAD